MIALVEGASRQKTPNEIALNILLAGLTIIFLIVVMTLSPLARYAGSPVSVTVLIALLVTLIPTTIGALLSAIGIAGMDRLVQHNVLAMSGRAVEAAGDVDVLLLDKTGHHHLWLADGGGVHPGAWGATGGDDGGRAALVAGGRDAGRKVDRGLRRAARAAGRSLPHWHGAEFIPFTRGNAHERRPPGWPRHDEGRGRRHQPHRARAIWAGRGRARHRRRRRNAAGGCGGRPRPRA